MEPKGAAAMCIMQQLLFIVLKIILQRDLQIVQIFI